MSVSVTYAATLTVVETLTGNTVDITTPTVTHNGFNTSGTYNSATTPPCTLMAAFQKALSTGTATIDLTALTGTNGQAVSFDGLKVQFFKFRNPSTNANPITVTFGASNGYLLGGTAWKYILQPGQEIMGTGFDATPDVSSSLKNIDLAGTGSQALDVILVAG